MKLFTCAVLAILASTAAFGQEWEFGAVGGGGFLNTVSATSPAGNATAGFKPGFTAGVFAGQNLYSHISGEIRYEYMQSNLMLSAGGQSAQFSGGAHAIHYDVVYHTSLDHGGREESRVQFFGAVGGGVKAFMGTGSQEAFQPLSQYGYFTRATTLKPMISAGGGITYRLGPKLLLRAEVRDFVSAFPTGVLTPAPGVKFGSMLHELVPMVGIVYVK